MACGLDLSPPQNRDFSKVLYDFRSSQGWFDMIALEITFDHSGMMWHVFSLLKKSILSGAEANWGGNKWCSWWSHQIWRLFECFWIMEYNEPQWNHKPVFLALFCFLICPAPEVQNFRAAVWKVCSWMSCPAQGSVSLRREFVWHGHPFFLTFWSSSQGRKLT